MTTSTGCGSNAGQFCASTNSSTAEHLAARVDVGEAFAQRLHLGLAEGRAQRLHLAVDVAFGDMVHVDQHQRSHAAAHKSFGRPRTDAADADDGHACGAQPLVAVVSVQPAQRAKAALQVGLERDGQRGHKLRSTRQA